MMAELVSLGFITALGLKAWPFFEDIVLDVTKDKAKDVVKKSFGSVFRREKADALTTAWIKAMGFLLERAREKLEEATDDADTIPYRRAMQSFTENPRLQEVIGRAFLDASPDELAQLLALAWDTAEETARLPDDFNWRNVARVFLRDVKSLRDDDGELREIFSTDAILEMNRQMREAVGVIAEFDMPKYAEALRVRCTSLNLDCADSSAAEYQRVRLWDVFVPQTIRESQEYLPQVLEMPLELRRRMAKSGEIDDADPRDGNELEEVRRRYFDTSPRPVLEALEDPDLHRLVLLGDPGAGKSALLRYVGLRWADAKTRPDRAPLPLLLELRDYAQWKPDDGKTILEYFEKGPNPVFRLKATLLKRQLTEGAAVLLADGLDEIFDPAEREIATDALIRFGIDFPDVPIVLTSRVVGFKGEPFRDAGFRLFMLQDLEDEQIEEFLEKWHYKTFDAPQAGERVRKLERLRQALEDHERIRELAGNPLLLTMMAILNRRQELPRERVELYHKCTEVLLDLWETEKLVDAFPALREKAIDIEDKRIILRRAAYAMQTAGEGEAGNVIPEDALREIVADYLKSERGMKDPKKLSLKLIEQLRGRDFALCLLGGSYYGFVHRTFMEYFCACEIVNRFESEELTKDELFNDVYGSHWNEDRWTEVLCLAAGMLKGDIPGEVILFLIGQPDAGDYKFRQVFLAARLFEEVRNAGRFVKPLKVVSERIGRLVGFEFPFLGAYEPQLKLEVEQIQGESALRFTQLVCLEKRDSAKHFLREHATKSRNYFLRRACIDALARGWRNDTDVIGSLKDLATNDEYWRIGGARGTCFHALARWCKDDANMVAWLQDVALSDYEPTVTRACIESLARWWKDDAKTLAWLKEGATNDDSLSVRCECVEALARYWKNDSDALAIIKDRAKSDEDAVVRSLCADPLVRWCKDDPETLQIVLTGATSDEAALVRVPWVRAFARGWNENSDTLSWLTERAMNDENSGVQSACVDELARWGKGDPDTLEWLNDRAVSHKSSFVRSACVVALAREFKDEPYTLAIIKERVQQDDSFLVRNRCVQALARFWREDPDTQGIFMDRAQNDRDNEVRRTCVRELVRWWHEDPNILDWIQHCALSDESSGVRRASVAALARWRKDDSGTLRIVRDRAQNEEDEDFRIDCIEGLVRWWGDNAEVMEYVNGLRAGSD